MKMLQEYGIQKKQFWESIRNKNLIMHLKLSALFYPESGEILKELEAEQAANPDLQIQVEQNYEVLWKIMFENTCGSMFSVRTRRKAGHIYPYLRKFNNSDSDSGTENEYMLITGNSTEAIYLLLQEKIKYLILVDANGICYISISNIKNKKMAFSELNKMEDRNLEVNQEVQFATGYGRKIVCHPYDRGNRSKLYETVNGKKLIKRSEDSDKLQWMLEHQPEISGVFAWPEKPVYRQSEKLLDWFLPSRPVGYIMKKRKEITRLDEIFNHDFDEFRRLKICLQIIKYILYLHMNGILVTDYNMENFQIDEKDNVIMLDCLEYTVHDHLSYHRAPNDQNIDFDPDYNKRIDVIKAEYRYLQALVYCILNDGIWPFKERSCDRFAGKFDEILMEGLTPQELLCIIYRQYITESHSHGGDARQYKPVREEKYKNNKNLKRRPLLVMVESSRYSEDQKGQIRECLQAMLTEMCNDCMTVALTDILVLAYGEEIHDVGLGEDANSFHEFLRIEEKISKLRIPEKDENVWLSHALLRAKEILCEKRKMYSELLHAKMPALIILGSFQTDYLNDPPALVEKRIAELNETAQGMNWTVIKVKFGEGDEHLMELINGEIITYHDKEDVKKIVDLLHYSSSLVLN